MMNNQPIRIYTTDFELISEIDNYQSLQFTRSWHGVGSFELHMNAYMKDANALQKKRLIVLSPDKVAIIKHREIPLDESGKASENWMIKGYQLKGIARQRITVPPAHTDYDRKSGNAETVMKHYIERHFVNPDDPSRKIPNLVIAPNQNRGPSISWQSRYKNVADELEEISKATGLGWDITIDYKKKQFVFDVYEGRNVSVNQSENPPVIFSPDFESIKSQSFSDSDLNMANVGYVGGQGEGVDRKIVELGNAAGLERIETFIDARDIEDDADLIPRGQQKLAELSNELYFEAQILSPVVRTTYVDTFESFVSPYQPNFKKERKQELYTSFRYGEDYDLGDIATVQNRNWGVTMDTRITELTEIYEPGGFILEAGFGQQRPTLLSKIKDELKQYEGLLKQ